MSSHRLCRSAANGDHVPDDLHSNSSSLPYRTSFESPLPILVVNHPIQQSVELFHSADVPSLEWVLSSAAALLWYVYYTYQRKRRPLLFVIPYGFVAHPLGAGAKRDSVPISLRPDPGAATVSTASSVRKFICPVGGACGSPLRRAAHLDCVCTALRHGGRRGSPDCGKAFSRFSSSGM